MDPFRDKQCAAGRRKAQWICSCLRALLDGGAWLCIALLGWGAASLLFALVVSLIIMIMYS
jgi:hypothetical protein